MLFKNSINKYYFHMVYQSISSSGYLFFSTYQLHQYSTSTYQLHHYLSINTELPKSGELVVI